MIVGVLAALFVVPLFLAGSAAVVLVGLFAGCAVLAVVVCRRPRGLPYPVVVVPVVVVLPWPVADWQPQLGWQPQPQIEDCPTATPSDWLAWSEEIRRRCRHRLKILCSSHVLS